MAKKKINLPISQGGLTRFFEGKTSQIEINPESILIFTILFALILLIIHKTNLLGF